jgi:methyl-accepting chemotaxis protein
MSDDKYTDQFAEQAQELAEHFASLARMKEDLVLFMGKSDDQTRLFNEKVSSRLDSMLKALESVVGSVEEIKSRVDTIAERVSAMERDASAFKASGPRGSA